MSAKARDIAKWGFDRAAALTGLIILSPVLLVISACIKMSQKHESIFFTQLRVGQHGHLFRIVKFRTMKGEGDESSVSVSGDSRITRLGAVLRRYKLDELPELWNVLKGDMSFVGPRPDVPGYADKLSGDDRLILTLKPGITGPATLKYRHEETLLAQQPDPKKYNDEVIWPDKVRINREYVDNHNFLGDLALILKTVMPI